MASPTPDSQETGRTAVPDEELLAGFLGGEAAMFTELVQRYEKPLYRLIARMTGSEAEAPDLFQETFLRVYQHADAFGGRSRFKTWLYAIALNVCRARHRQKRVQTIPLPQPLQPPQTSASAPDDPAAVAGQKEIGRRVAVAVAALPPEQREVFILKTYQGLNYRQIAAAVGRPIGTVKSQMRLGLVKMRAALHDLAKAYGAA